MRIQDRKLRRTLTRIAGVVLMTLSAASIAYTLAYSGDNQTVASEREGLPSVFAQRDGADAAPEVRQAARTSDIDRHTDPDNPAVVTGAARRVEDADTALLLDWHQDANNLSGALHPEEMTHPN